MKLTFEFADGAYDDLCKLQKETNKPNQAEVIRAALSLYKFLQEAQQRGGVVIVRDEQGEREVILP